MAPVGIGLRASHYDAWLEHSQCPTPIVEAVTENFLGRGGRPRALLHHVRNTAHLFLHGVSLSLGGLDPLDDDYLRQLRSLADEVDPLVLSDHVSFGKVRGISGHDLWPLPRTEEALNHVAARIDQVQQRLGRRMAVENVSSYISVEDPHFSEEAFLVELAERADCLLLLDINNVVVSAHNFGFDPVAYVQRIPPHRVSYMHVAGHSLRDGYRFDDHGSVPGGEVLDLLALARQRFPNAPCIFEWDENVPDLNHYVAAAADIDRRTHH